MPHAHNVYRKQQKKPYVVRLSNKQSSNLAAQKWSKGAKGKGGKDSKAEKEDKAAAAVARKQEAARLLEEEESNLPSKPKAVKKSAPPAKRASPAASKANSIPDFDDGVEDTGYSASGQLDRRTRRGKLM